MHLPKQKILSGIENANSDFYKTIGSYINSCQSASGGIPSLQNGKLDPWDHIESIMALVIVGNLDEAKQGFTWLKKYQNVDGSWYSEYVNDKPTITNKQTHFSAYMAVGLIHYFLASKDIEFIKQMWPSLIKAIDFSISLQNQKGTIPWCINEDGLPDDEYLLTASSSILKSLECGIALFKIINDQNQSRLESWELAYKKLRRAIRNPEGLFDLKLDRKRFSMDSYYPVLSGAFNQAESKKIIKHAYNNFYIKGIGIKCVIEEPWVTVAETNEFVLAAIKANEVKLAKEIFLESLNISDEENIPYMGWQYEENIFWPDEKPTWTAAALMLAADAIYKFTDGNNLFLENQLKIFD